MANINKGLDNKSVATSRIIPHHKLQKSIKHMRIFRRAAKLVIMIGAGAEKIYEKQISVIDSDRIESCNQSRSAPAWAGRWRWGCRQCGSPGAAEINKLAYKPVFQV